MGKRKLRHDMVAAQARRHNVPVIWVNQVGGNDQIVFDGSSFAMDASGSVIATAASFAEDLVLFDTAHPAGTNHSTQQRRVRSGLRSSCDRHARLRAEVRIFESADRFERRHR